MVKRSRHRPFTAVTRVRFPMESPLQRVFRYSLFSFFVIMFIQDVKTALYGMKYAPEIYGGRYGLGSKDVTPGMVHSVFDNLYHKHPVD